ncbi:phage holin family protein [Streptomyces swartbergensis]
MFALANVMDTAWAALIVTAVWAGIAAVLSVMGRGRCPRNRSRPWGR